jgi:hypothetical protein
MNPFNPDILYLEEANMLIYVKDKEIRVHRMVSNTNLQLHEFIKKCREHFNHKFFFKMDKIYYFNNTILLLKYFDKINNTVSYIGFNIQFNDVVKINQIEFEEIFSV